MTIETLLDLYIDMNILMLLAALGWAVLLSMLKRTRLQHYHQTLLRGSYAICALVLVLPLILLLIGNTGPAAPVLSMVSLSDFAVAQFLNGHIEMSPMVFENALNLRKVIVHDAVAFQGTVGQGIALLLLAGISLGALRLGRDLLQVHRLRRESYLLRRCGRVRIMVSEAAKIPFSTRGPWSHYVVIPTEFLIRPGDLRIAVSHELQHIRQGDVTWEVVLEFLRPVFYWNPAFRFLKREIEHRRELVCDRQVLARRRADLAEYADCLLRTCERMLQTHRSQGRLPTPTVPFAARPKASAQKVLVTRFETLCQPVQAKTTALPAIFLAALMLFVLISSAAIHASSEWSHDRIMLSTIVNLERLDGHAISQVNW